MAPQLRRLALPVEERLARAIAEFDCVGEDHDGDPVAANVNDFLVSGRYQAGLQQDISTTYLLIDQEQPVALIG